MLERRRFIRWQIDRQAKVTLPDQKTSVDCQVKDISYKGVQISLVGHLEKDKYIDLSISLSYNCTLNVEAWVTWHKTIDGHNLYGLYFSKIKDQDKERIYQFIRSNFNEQLKKQWWQGSIEQKPKEKGGEEMEDRRIFARLSTELRLRFLDSKGNREGLAKTVDISAKGMGIESSEELAPQTPLEMWLNIPDRGEPLYIRGEVVWSKQIDPNLYRAGINLEKAYFMSFSRVLRAA